MKHAGVSLIIVALSLATPVSAGKHRDKPSAKAIFESRDTSLSAFIPNAMEENVVANPGQSPETEAEAAPPRLPIATKARPTGLRYRIKLLDGTDAVVVPNNRVFRSGEQIQLLLKSNVDAYLAILQINADSSMELLYPAADIGLVENHVQAHREVVFPGPEHGFKFIEQPGTERLLVVLSQHKHQLDELNLETRITSLEGAKLLDEADSLAGDKRLQIVEVARSEAATYAVNIGGGYVLQEIRLAHR